MMYVIHNKKFVAAVTNSAKKLTEWLRETELPQDMKVTTLEYGFPLMIVEDDTGFSFFPGEDNDEKKQVAHMAKSRRGTLYEIPDCWRGTPNFTDYMGALSHTHFE